MATTMQRFAKRSKNQEPRWFQNGTKENKNKGVQTYLSLRNSDLLFIGLLLGLLCRHWLQGDLHHDCKFGS